MILFKTTEFFSLFEHLALLIQTDSMIGMIQLEAVNRVMLILYC